MNGIIETLFKRKDKTNTPLYPVTSAKAVYYEDGKTADEVRRETEAVLAGKVDIGIYAGDLNSLTKDGHYRLTEVTNGPPGVDCNYANMLVISGTTTDSFVQFIFIGGTGGVFIRRYWAHVWTAWSMLATATPPQEFTLSPEPGMIGSIWYSKNQFGELLICGDVGNANGYVANTDIRIVTLPEGFRPSNHAYQLAASSRFIGSDGGVPADVKVYQDGTIHYYSSTSPGAVLYFSGIAK